MEILAELDRLYEEYEEQFQQMERARRPGEGIFGLGRGPGDHPCHGQFAKDMEDLLRRYAAQGPDPGEAARALERIYFAPLSRERDAVYWMMLAVHSLTGELAERLSPGDAADLLRRYGKAYPRLSQLPAQRELTAVLKKRAAAG